MKEDYEREHAAAFFDEYGEREWTRFEDGRTPPQSVAVRERVEETGLEERVTERVLADVTDLSRFDDASFDAVVCYGGPLSYVVDRAEEGSPSCCASRSQAATPCCL